MTNIERYTLFCALLFAIGCAGLFYGQAHGTICVDHSGPDVLVPRACTGAR